MKLSFIIISFLLLFSVHARQINPSDTIGSLRLISTYTIPYNHTYAGTTAGGLSGIDYDATQQLYYVVSDDRSAIQPARFYSMRIFLGTNKIDSIQFIGVHPFLQFNGTAYPSAKQNPQNTPDPESIRYNTNLKQLVWTSEGERIVRANDTILQSPAINIVTPDGKYIDAYALPNNLHMQAIAMGPRQNGTLEGLSFADNFKKLYASLEEPLYEDGPRADTIMRNAYSRIYQFDVQTKKATAQYAYLLEPIAHAPKPSTAFAINGITDILSIDKQQFLVMERSFSTGRLPCTIKIFKADFSQAEDVSGIKSLTHNPPVSAIKKTLLLNLDDLGIYTDNIEGMTIGPRLPNGHSTLLLIADNNFSPLQQTQILLFEIIP